VTKGDERPTPDAVAAGPRPALERQVAFELLHARLFKSLAEPVMLDRFVLAERVGQGGMGVVYAAFDPRSDRQVALKVVRPERAGPLASARLQREARAAAALAHPNVVTVYETGSTPAGELFIAMELVHGQTLRQWLDEGVRPWRTVVETMIAAGEGLAAAHAVGLVHRDFKPENVLIGADGRPRVADFGLVRLVEGSEPSGEPMSSELASIPETASLTRTGMVVGTLGYMPLEQLQGQDADARSDQFGFCVSLYEALHGERPFEGNSLAALMQAMEAPRWRPVPNGRKVPEALRRLVLRGLATAPEQRWPSMEALLVELRRQVAPHTRRTVALALGLGLVGGLTVLGLGLDTNAEPEARCEGAQAQLDGIWDDARKREVEAVIVGTGLPYAPDTWARVEEGLDAYALAWTSKHTEVCEATSVRHEQAVEVMDLRMACLRDHRVALRESVGVLAKADATTVEQAVTLVAGLPGPSRCDDVEALRAQLPPPADAEQGAKVEVLRELLARARSLSDAGSYPASSAVVEQVTEQALALGYAPLLAEALLHRGNSRRRESRYVEAEQDLEQAYLLATEQGHDAVRASAAVGLVSVVGSHQAQYESGQKWGRAALILASAAHVDREIEVRALAAVAELFHAQGEHEDALSHYQRALALGETTLGPTHPDVAAMSTSIGGVLAYQGKPDEALVYLQRALALGEAALGPAHPRVADALVRLGDVLITQGKLAEALGHLERALAIRERTFGPKHPDVAATLYEIGDVLVWQGKSDDALVRHQQALAIKEEVLGPSHPDVATSQARVGAVLFELRRLEAALELFRRALAIREEALGPEHSQVGSSLLDIGRALGMVGHYEEALEHYRRALVIKERTLGPRHPDMGNVHSHIAAMLQELDRHAEALEHSQQALSIWEQAWGPEHPRLVYPLLGLALGNRDLEDFATARVHAERAVAIMEAGEVSVELASARFILAQVLWPDQAQRPRALALAKQARDAFAEQGESRRVELERVDAWLRRVGAKRAGRRQ